MEAGKAHGALARLGGSQSETAVPLHGVVPGDGFWLIPRCGSSILRSGDEDIGAIARREPGYLPILSSSGKIASGNLADRDEILSSLMDFTRSFSGDPNPKRCIFLERNRLMGRGIGYIDVHLLGGPRPWLRRRDCGPGDQRLEVLARGLDLSWPYDQAQTGREVGK